MEPPPKMGNLENLPRNPWSPAWWCHQPWISSLSLTPSQKYMFSASEYICIYNIIHIYIYISPSVLFSSFDQFDLLREIEDRIMAIIKAGNYEVTINELPCTSPRSAVYIQDFPPHSLWFPVTCSRDNEREKSCWNNDTMPFYKW